MEAKIIWNSAIKIAEMRKKENSEASLAEINGVSQTETHKTARTMASTRKHPSAKNIPPRNAQK